MFKHSSRVSVLTVLLAAPAASALAQGFGPLPYDYVHANYAFTELDSGGIDLGASFEVANRVIVFGSLQDWELGDRYDRETLQIGGGYRWSVRPNMDFVAKLAYADNEIDPPGPGRFDDDGLILSGMLRGWLSRSLELSGELLLDDSVGSDLDTVLEFGGQYYRQGNVSFGGRLRVDEDETTIFVGARFYFGASRRGGPR